MIVDKYIRYYFNMNGRFDKTMRYYDLIAKRAEYQNMSVDAYLYSRLGYPHSLKYPADKIASLRHLAAKRHYNVLSKMLNVSNVSELNEELRHIGASPDYVYPVKGSEKVIDIIASCIANYMKSLSDFKVYDNVPLDKYAKMLKYINNKTELENIMKSEYFESIINAAMPKFAVRKNCTPYITGGLCFVPYRLSASDIKAIKVSIKTYLIRPIFLTTAELNFCNKVFLYLDDLYETDVNMYLKLIDIAVGQGLTVNELANNLGYRLTDIDKQISESNIIYYLNDDKSVKVYTMYSTQFNHFVVLPFIQFKALYEKDIVRFISWDDDDNLTLLNEAQLRAFNRIQQYTSADNTLLINDIREKKLEPLKVFGG